MSQTLFWILLLTGVAVIGGVIAFLGDSVGRRVGRKHLRLFGLRPKTTGLVFAIGSGVLVALFTVGTVALLARTTVDNALRAQDIYQELQNAKKQFTATTLEYQTTRNDLETSRKELHRLTGELEGERAQLKVNQAELTATTSLNGRLGLKVMDLERERNTVAVQIAQKTRELERLAARMASLESQGRRSTLRIQNLGTELSDLETQRDGLNRNLSDLNRNLSDLNAQSRKLDVRIKDLVAEKVIADTRYREATARQEQLQADVARLDASRAALKNDVGTLELTKTNLETSVSRLESQNADLQRQLSQTETQLSDTQSQLAEATSGNFIFRQGDLVLQSVVEGTTADEVKIRLQAMLQQVNKLAQSRGAPRSKQVTIKPSNDLDTYVRAVLRTSTPDLIVLRSSRSVTQTGIEFPITLQVLPNTALYSAGQPIASRELSLAVGDASLRVALENLSREAEQQLREQLVPKENIATLPDEDIRDILERLKGMTGTVWVAVASRQDVQPSGPIRMYLSMLR